jgi:protocatechuate 3,4-dioxygenase beta subunit
VLTRHLPGTRTRVLLLLLILGSSIAGVVSIVQPAQARADAPPTATGTNPSCPASNPPSALTLVAGTPQSAMLDTAYGDLLQVALAAANGCPLTGVVAGTPVTFNAPAGGASGTFAASGSNTVTVGGDATGMASAPKLTANDIAGSFTIVASSAYGSVSFSLTNSAAGVPAAIRTLAPRRQTARANTRYGSPLRVEVLDENGTPIEGTSVTFVLGTGGGGAQGASTASGSAGGNGAGATFADGSTEATELTNTSGIARSPLLTANAVAGAFTATATVQGLTAPATFSLDTLAGTPPAIRLVGHARRSAPAGARYRSPLAVKVVDGSGRAMEGLSVTFTLGASSGASSTGSGPGSASPGATFVAGSTQATATTNAAGIATSPRFQATTAAGRFTATAAVSGSARVATFALRNLPGKPATITVGAAAAASTEIGLPFPVRLAVTVSDANANPVGGAVVTFSAPAGGPSGAFSFGHGETRTIRVRTNADGIAIAPVFRADGTQGGYVVTASVTHAGDAAFALVNQPSEQ